MTDHERLSPVWCVWTEHGDYENHSRDLRGVFATEELAEAHAAQIRQHETPDVCEVISEDVLGEIPSGVPWIKWSAHITPSGREDEGLGYERDEKFKTWSNEITAARGRLDRWSYPGTPDLYVEVIGCDPEAVQAEYNRLLAVAREQLASGEQDH